MLVLPLLPLLVRGGGSRLDRATKPIYLARSGLPAGNRWSLYVSLPPLHFQYHGFSPIDGNGTSFLVMDDVVKRHVTIILTIPSLIFSNSLEQSLMYAYLTVWYAMCA